MKRILINVTYTECEKKGYWQHSNLINKIVEIDMKNFHNEIARLCNENDYVNFCYNNKPQTEMFIDDNKQIGFIYRCISEFDNHKVRFDAWVEVHEVIELNFDEIK